MFWEIKSISAAIPLLVLAFLGYLLPVYAAPQIDVINQNMTSLGPAVQVPPPSIINDSQNIPLVYYGNVTGYQRNPVTTSRHLSDLCDSLNGTTNMTTIEYIKNNANWLIVNEKHYGNYSLLEYKFPYRYNLTPPWHSALAQGFAIQGLVKAYKITNNGTYFGATRPLLNSFYVDVKDGGITEKTDSDGWWYEEYAGENGTNPRVLNGMMYDLLALYDYENFTGNPRAEYLFNQGVLALKNNISKYDDNGSSYYDLEKTVGVALYEQIHVDQLEQLYKITGEPIFLQYHDKWKLKIDLSNKVPAKIPEFDHLSSMIIAISIIGILVIPWSLKLHF